MLKPRVFLAVASMLLGCSDETQQLAERTESSTTSGVSSTQADGTPTAENGSSGAGQTSTDETGPDSSPGTPYQGPSRSCGEGGEIEGAIEEVEYDGSWYWLGVPAGARDEPLPMVVAIHGDEGHPNNMRAFWEPVFTSEQDFILMAPQCPADLCLGTGTVNTWSQGGHIRSEAQAEWLLGAIADVARNYNVDNSRIFAVGYSGGAIFLGYQGFKRFQDVFAGIQWVCGGVNETEAQVYAPPPAPACKVPGLLVISESGDRDYLVTAARRIEEILLNNGHLVEFIDTGCSGHCCMAQSLAPQMWTWFQGFPQKCGAGIGPECSPVDAIP